MFANEATLRRQILERYFPRKKSKAGVEKRIEEEDVWEGCSDQEFSRLISEVCFETSPPISPPLASGSSPPTGPSGSLNSLRKFEQLRDKKIEEVN